MTTHRIETADGLTLHVEETGPVDGPPVVLVHGWPDTSDVWAPQVDALVAGGHRVIRHDQRGFGRSDRPVDVAGYHVFNAMADIGSILDALDVESAHLVGHDWGAPPCWLTATMAPERVRSLTAVSVGHPGAFRSAGLEQRRRSFYMLLFQFVDVAEEWLSMDDWANLRELLHHPADIGPRLEELSKPGALTSSLNWYRANISPQSLVEPPVELPNVTVPTLGIMGADDWALTEEQMSESDRFVDAEWRYELVPGAAHWVQTEQPAIFNDLVAEWIAAHDG
jgi:pimeloyl-ACP methyl ester carboxylesterase